LSAPDSSTLFFGPKICMVGTNFPSVFFTSIAQGSGNGCFPLVYSKWCVFLYRTNCRELKAVGIMRTNQSTAAKREPQSLPGPNFSVAGAEFLPDARFAFSGTVFPKTIWVEL